MLQTAAELKTMSVLPISIPLILCLIVCSGFQCDSADVPSTGFNADWPQYEANPFVIKLDIPLLESLEDTGGSVIVWDLNGDGLMDYLITRRGHIAAYDHFGKKLWIKKTDIVVGGSSEGEGLPGHHGPGVQAGDIDGDGKVEVLFLTRDGKLNIVDGATGREKKSVKMSSPKGTERWEHVVIANFRGKGDRDILLQATNKDGYRMGRYLAAYALDNLENPLWETDQFIACAHNGARIADLNGDGRDEVPGSMFVSSDGKVTKIFDLRGHIDGLYFADVLPENPGLEAVALEEGGGNRIFCFNGKKLFWITDHRNQEPQNGVIGSFVNGAKGKQIWCRSRYNTHQKPFLFDSDGQLISDYEMSKVAPKGWTDSGVEVINTIDWTGESKQLAAAKERHTSGDVAIFEPNGGKFIKVFKEKADRFYVADVSGDWREEIIVLSGNELRIYHNPDKNPNPNRPRLWNQQHYRRSKMTWNYYSP